MKRNVHNRIKMAPWSSVRTDIQSHQLHLASDSFMYRAGAQKGSAIFPGQQEGRLPPLVTLGECHSPTGFESELRRWKDAEQDPAP